MGTYITESLRSFYNYIISKFQRQEDRSENDGEREFTFAVLLSKIEQYIVPIQALLIWERPYISAIVLIFVNCLFWYTVSLVKRVYSFICVIAIVIFLYRTWINQIWPEIRVAPPDNEDIEEWTPVHPQVLSAPELSRYLDKGWKCSWQWIFWFKDLRARSHGVFCFIVSCIFGSLALIGQIIPGVVISYTLLMIILLGPGVVLYVIPMSWYDQLKDVVFPVTRQHDASIQGDDSDMDEFLPENSNSVLSELSLQHEHNVVGVDEAAERHTFGEAIAKELGMEDLINEEDDTSLYQGLESFPSVEDEEESGDEMELSQPENGDDKNGINMVPTYYKEESSDTDNELFSVGLTFTDIGENTDSNSNNELLDNNSVEPTENVNLITIPESLQQSSRSSDIDIEEYEIVSKSDLS